MSIAYLAQITSLSPEHQRMLYVFSGLFVVAAILLIIFIKSFSGKKSRCDSLELDTHFLDGLEGTKGLTPEEKKKVREAMVRRALREEEKKKSGDKNLSIEHLAALASQGPDVLRESTAVETEKPAAQATAKSTVPDPPEPPAKPAPPKEPKSLAEIRVTRPVTPAKKQPPKPSGGTIDLDSLLERGLIDPAEYDRLKQLAEESSR